MGNSEKISSNEELILLRDICPSTESLVLTEQVETPKGEYTGVVLASLDGPVMDYKIPTRNERLYEEELCDEIAESEYVAELIETKNFLGEPDHPMKYENRLDIHYPNVSHAIRNLRKIPDKGCYYATFDILDTPNGRILKTLIDYGTKLGVSSRGSGRTITKMGKVVVDKSTYRFITFDIVCMPGNKIARLPVTNESLDQNDTAQTLTEQISNLIESNDYDSLRSIKPVLNFLSENAEVQTLIEKVDSKLNAEESNTITESATADLLEAYSRIKDLKSQLQAKDSIIKSQKTELDQLHESYSGLQDTSSELSSKLDRSMDAMKTHIQKEQATRKLLESMKLKLSQSEKRVTTLQESLDSSKKEISQKDSRIKKLSENISSVSSSKDDQLGSMNESLTRANADLESMSEQMHFHETRYDGLASRYFSVRCTQLGLDEKLLRKSLGESLSTYEIDDLEEVLHEAYRKKTKRVGQPLVESLSRSAKVGGTVVTANRSNLSPQSSVDPEMEALTESCRAVRNSK